jgi:hypothetical protein
MSNSPRSMTLFDETRSPMVRTFRDRLFEGVQSLREPVVVSDLELVRCTFRGCNVWTLEDPSRRAVIRNIRVENCRIVGESSKVRGAVVEDCVIDGLNAGGLMHMDGCAFRHVAVRGRIGVLMLTNAPLVVAPETKRKFVEANAEYYEGVDWALDIREAECDEQMGLRGIPSALIRRDPRTQVVVTRKRIEEHPWVNSDLDSRVRSWMSMMVRFGWEDEVFVVPAKHPRRQSMLDSLAKLRELGIAELD